jgi:hypothetical protein
MMKKLIMFVACLVMVFCFSIGSAENSSDKEDYTVVSVNGVFNIRGITPDGYSMTDVFQDGTTIGASFESTDLKKPSFVLVISFLEEYANVERLNDLSEEERMNLIDMDPTLSENIETMETEFGTQVMILHSKNPEFDFASFVTLYKGYEVGLNLFPGIDSEGSLTEDQILQAMKFLSDLEFVPNN